MATLRELLALAPGERQALARAGRDWVKRFDAGIAIGKYLAIYQRIFETELSHVDATLKRLRP
jgi:hypothetical protein